MTALVLSLFIGLLGAEIHVCLPAFARWLIRWCASKLSPDLRERMLEEWLAEVEASPSHFQKVIFALGLFTGFNDLVRAHGEKKLPKIHGDVNVTLTGVSGTGSVGNLTPSSEPGEVQLTGHASPGSSATAGNSTLAAVGASLSSAVGSFSGASTVLAVNAAGNIGAFAGSSSLSAPAVVIRAVGSLDQSHPFGLTDAN